MDASCKNQSMSMEGDIPASPMADGMESLANKSIASLNETFITNPENQYKEVVVNQDILQPTTPTEGKVDLILNSNIVNMIQNRVFQELKEVFNTKVFEFFGKLEDSLENIVLLKLEDMQQKGTLQPSMQEPPLLSECTAKAKTECEERILKFEKKLEELNPKLDKLDTLTENGGLYDGVKSMQDELSKKLQEAADHVLAKNIADEADHPVPTNLLLKTQLDEIQRQIKHQRTLIDNLEQYGRLNILQLKKIPVEDRNGKEDTTKVALGFLGYHLNLHLDEKEISVCHRTINPEEKRKAGKNYIPTIYIKFVRRSVAQDVLKKRYRLRNAKNRFGQPYSITENLTLCRRKLYDRAEKELHSFTYGWIKNGNIFVKKSRDSRPIKITSEEKLQELLDAQEKNSYRSALLRSHTTQNINHSI